VYSFGVVLWELLACAKPYNGMHYAQIVHAIAQSKVGAGGGKGGGRWGRGHWVGEPRCQGRAEQGECAFLEGGLSWAQQG
jgi:hypothetical protein